MHWSEMVENVLQQECHEVVFYAVVSEALFDFWIWPSGQFLLEAKELQSIGIKNCNTEWTYELYILRNSLLQSVVHVIPSIIYTELQSILKPRGEISSEDRPLDFWKDVAVARGEAMLQCVGKIWIESVADSCLSICDTIIFCPWIALGNNRNTWIIASVLV